MYDRKGYDLKIDYTKEPNPRLKPEATEWRISCLRKKACGHHDVEASAFLHQLAAQYRDGLADQDDASFLDADLDDTAPARNLVSAQRIATELLRPVRAETAVRRATDRIFVDADPGAKNRETKSWPPELARPVTITPRTGNCSSRRISGCKPRTCSSVPTSTKRSNRLRPAYRIGA